MGRELKRKQAKREGKNVKEVQKKEKDKPLSLKTFITIIVAMLLLFVLLFILTGNFVTGELKWFNKDNSNSNETNTITNKILASDSLRQKEEKYYVYFYNPKEEDSEISSIISSIDEEVYRVDLSDDFNSNYIGTPSGKVENISDLKVENPTLIKVINEEIVEFYSGSEEIKIALE